MRGNRGVVQGAVLVGLTVLVIAVAVPVWKSIKSFEGLFSSDSKQKTQVTQLVDTQAQAAAAQKVKDDAAAAAQANLAKTQTAKDMRIDQAHQYVVGTSIALAKESNPSINVQVAATLNSDADKAMDPLDQAKIDAMHTLVEQLTAKDTQDVAAGDAKLTDMANQLATERQVETTLRGQQVVLNAQVVTDQVTVNTLQGQITKDGAALKGWATDNKSLLTRIAQLTMWLIILGSVLFVVHWLFPLIAKAFPEVPILSTIAKRLAAVFAYPLHALHAAEKALLAKAKTEVESLLATTKTQLTSEIAAHQATQATLIAVATAPDPSTPTPKPTS